MCLMGQVGLTASLKSNGGVRSGCQTFILIGMIGCRWRGERGFDDRIQFLSPSFSSTMMNMKNGELGYCFCVSFSNDTFS